MLFRKKIRKQFAITIPDPCSEVWSEMKVVDSCHRHCAACDRVLTDFAQMNDDELLLFFKHANGKICGRFRVDQLNRPLTPLPERTTKAVWWKAALLLPFTLFSKSGNAQQVTSGDTVSVVQLDSNSIAPHVDSAQVPVTLEPYNWKPGSWIDSGSVGHPEIIMVTGGVPLYFEWNQPICVTMPTGFMVDTIAITPPLTEASAGINAAANSPKTSVPAEPESAHVAQQFGRIIPEEKRK